MEVMASECCLLVGCRHCLLPFARLGSLYVREGGAFLLEYLPQPLEFNGGDVGKESNLTTSSMKYPPKYGSLY